MKNRDHVHFNAINCCVITQNFVKEWKTCSEVFQFLNCTKNALALEKGKGLNHLAESCPEVDGNNEMVSTSDLMLCMIMNWLILKRDKVCGLKFTTKSAGYSLVRRQISVKKGELNHHYEPCGCKSASGKDCLCLLNKTCCEKYCGGCRCAKNQCRTRQCPCVAADRECDPDVCRNCFISCGDGTCGAPPQKDQSDNCMNMKLLQKQHQKVLLGRSDVSGWGTFAKNACEKDECIGEYKGELITHHEANKRGKIYDRINSSYLFDLNDQYVLDALRMGNKLKSANHSANPNCYGKVLFVAGDHRIGIFASKKISAGQELFYDYFYKEEVAPKWARHLEVSGSDKDEDYTPSRSRAKRKALGSKKDDPLMKLC